MLADRPDGRRLNAEEQRLLDDLEHRLLSEPTAPPRAVPVGLAATRRPADRRVLVAGLAVVCVLLVLATIVGGPAGLAATTVAVLATLLVCTVPRLGSRVRRPRLALPRRLRPPR